MNNLYSEATCTLHSPHPIPRWCHLQKKVLLYLSSWMKVLLQSATINLAALLNVPDIAKIILDAWNFVYVKYISTQVSGINFASGTCYTPVLRRIFRRLQNSNCWIFFNFFQRWTRQRRRWARRTRRGWSSLYGGLMFPWRSLEVKLSFLREHCGGFWPKLWTEKMDDLQYLGNLVESILVTLRTCLRGMLDTKNIDLL